MNKTVSSVIDDINEWAHPQYGTTYYVTAIFTDESVGSVGRKDQDAALEVQGLLREAIGQELDFTLEAKGQTKTGRDKFTIKGFGTPGGAATYTAPGVQGGVVAPSAGGAGRTRSPEHDQFIQERMDRRTALMQAVTMAPLRTMVQAQPPHGDGSVTVDSEWPRVADEMYAWLRKTSEPASSAYGDTPQSTSSTELQAGVGSETTSPAAGSPGDAPPIARPASNGAETPAGDTTSVPRSGRGNAATGGPSPSGEGEDTPPVTSGEEASRVGTEDRGGQSDGEAGCPPHDLDLDVAPKAMRYPCRRCKAWVKPTMAAEAAEEAAR